MPGDQWQKFANLRVMFGYMFTHPGAKLLFQGGEFGQYAEWNFQQSLDWHLLENKLNVGISKLISDLNKIYRKESALHGLQFSPEGFEWIDYGDYQNSVLSYIRKDDKGNKVVVICNFTPVPRLNYRIGIEGISKLKLLLNSDNINYSGTGNYKNNKSEIETIPSHGSKTSVSLDLPPLGILIFKAN